MNQIKDNFSAPPAALRTRGKILDALASGRFSVGDALPPHRTWAGELGVSNITVSQAFALLSEDDIVESHARSSTTLRRIPLRHEVESITYSATRPPCITLWANDHKHLSKMRSAIERHRFQQRFSSRHETVEFREKQLELESTDTTALILNSMIRGSDPTFYHTSLVSLPFMLDNDIIAPLGGDRHTQEFLDAYLSKIRPEYVEQVMKSDGNQNDYAVMLPNTVTYSFLTYSKQCMCEAGLDQPAKTLDELADQIRQLTEHRGKPALHIFYWSEMMQFLLDLMVRFEEHPPTDTASMPDLNSEAWGTVLKWFTELYNAGAVEVHDENSAPFLTKCLGDEIPILYECGSIATQILQFNEDERFSIAAMPVGPNGSNITLVNLGGHIVNANAEPHDRAAALEYLMEWEAWLHEDSGGENMLRLGIQPQLCSIYRDNVPDLYRPKLPSAWSDTIAELEKSRLWEAPGTAWLRILVGDALRALMRDRSTLSLDILAQTIRTASAGLPHDAEGGTSSDNS